jgi:hypothetical protein
VGQDYHPPFNPLGREMMETVPDYCRSRVPDIDKVPAIMYHVYVHIKQN